MPKVRRSSTALLRMLASLSTEEQQLLLPHQQAGSLGEESDNSILIQDQKPTWWRFGFSPTTRHYPSI